MRSQRDQHITFSEFLKNILKTIIAQFTASCPQKPHNQEKTNYFNSIEQLRNTK